MASAGLNVTNRTDLVIAVNVILSLTTMSCLALRFAKVTGNAKQRKFDAQNIMIVLAGFCGVMMSVLQCVATGSGLGHHAWNVSATELINFYKLYVAIFCFYLACNMFVKFALLCFYRHTTYERWHHWAIWVMQFVAFGFGVSSIIVIVFQCVPLTKLWDPEQPGSCIDVKAFFYSNSIIMICNDIVLYIMPIIFTWKLQLRMPQRIVLNMLFALGALVVASSFVRLYVIYRYDQDGDLPWNIASSLLWSAVENHLAIFIACAPSIKAVVGGVLVPVVTSQFSSIKNKISKSRGTESSQTQSTHKSPNLTLATIGSGPSRFARRVRDPFATTRRDSFNTLDSGFEYVNRDDNEMHSIERADSESTLAESYRKGSDASALSSKEPQVVVYSIDEAMSPTQTSHHMTLDRQEPQVTNERQK